MHGSRAFPVRLAAVLVCVLAATSCAPEPDTAPRDEGSDIEEPDIEEPRAGEPDAEEPRAGEPDAEEPGAGEPGAGPDPETGTEQPLAMHGVSAGDAAAVDTGLAILGAGGSAVDAAIATAFALAVVEPFASGPGGGGAALVAVPGRTPEAYDYREVVPQEGVVSADGIGIPGFAAGMRSLHEDHGRLPWDELVAPAVAMADEGVPTSELVAAQLRSAAHRLPVAALPEFFPDGQPLDAGAPLLQREFAATLQRLADAGPDDLYTGILAEELATAVDGIDAPSLAAYTVQRDPPVRGAFAGYDVIAPAPALPGAPFIQQLQIAEALDVGGVSPDGADHLHRMLMAWRIADASITDLLGDPAFVDVPIDELTEAPRNAELADAVPDDGFVELEPGGQPAAPEPETVTAGERIAPTGTRVAPAGNTTHITVVDADGTMVSMTNTLTNFWGSGQRELGFFLNDQLRRFSIGTQATNRPEPGRRSVSWGLPILVLDEQDRAVLGAGSPGGRRIPNILANVLVRWALHDEPLQAAVDAPRHHLEDAVAEVETLPPREVVDGLLERGYAGLAVPEAPYYFGSVQVLEVDHDTGEVSGATDPRREGDWRVERP